MSLKGRVVNLEAELKKGKDKIIVFCQAEREHEPLNWKDALLGDSNIHVCSKGELQKVVKAVEKAGMQPVVITICRDNRVRR